MEAGKEYPIKVQFDRSSIWDATATARDIGTSMLLVATTTDTNFVAPVGPIGKSDNRNVGLPTCRQRSDGEISSIAVAIGPLRTDPQERSEVF